MFLRGKNGQKSPKADSERGGSPGLPGQVSQLQQGGNATGSVHGLLLQVLSQG